MRTSVGLTLLLAGLCAAAQGREPATVRIGVLSLFHPRALVLTPRAAALLRMDSGNVLLPANERIVLHAEGARLSVELPDDATFSTRCLAMPAGSFNLTVPGKLSRVYAGELTVCAAAGTLVAVVAMDTETAVSSIVAAESPPHAAFEALKAQAVASRSFLLASPHPHSDFEACDTTHCQFLRAPPAPSSAAARATAATRGLVLTWRPSADAPPQMVRAMYSRSCGGQTHALRGAGAGQYPFYGVTCQFCRRHPELWSRSAGPSLPTTEDERIRYGRRYGWSALPSTNYRENAAGQEKTNATILGRGWGHGVGLCQLGANDLAQHGESFSAILAHFYPNTALTLLH